MERRKNIVRTMSEIGIFAALGFVIDELQGVIGKGLFVAGGSIGFAMIAIIIIGIRRGWLPAIITGLIVGLLDFATGATILHPAQAMLDYIFPYSFAALGTLLIPIYRNANTKGEKVLSLILITTAAGLCKFISHYLAGVFFWNDAEWFAWNLNYMNPYLYSLVYNIAYIGPSIVITAGLLVLIYFKAPIILNATKFDDVIEDTSEIETTNKKDKRIIELALAITYITIGFTLYIIYFIKYIKSIAMYDGGFDANKDSMVIFILALLVLIMGIIHIIRTVAEVKKPSNILALLGGDIVVLASLIYGTAELIKAYNKGKDPTTYWLWFALSLAVLSITLILTFISNRKIKNTTQL